MKLTNKDKLRKVLKALSKAHEKLEKYINTQPLKNYKTPPPLLFKEMKRDFENFHKIEREYLSIAKKLKDCQ